MKSNNEKSIAELYKYHIKLITFMISLIMVSIFALVFLNINKNNKDDILINMLGRQRMLTQMMAKDVGRIYEIDAVIEGNLYDKSDEASLKDKLSETIKELKESRDEYDKQFAAIKAYKIDAGNKVISFKGINNKIDPIIIENDKVWDKFKIAINTVLTESRNSPNYLQAIKYINENNDVLLNYSNQTLDEVMGYNNNKSLSIYYTVLAITILMLIALGLFIRNAYNNLFLPISQLSSGILELGAGIESDAEVQFNNSEVVPVFSEVKAAFDQFNSLIYLIENLNQNIPFRDTLNYIFKSFSKYIPYTYIGVALIDGSRIKASYGISGRHHKNLGKRLLGFEMPLSQTSLSHIAETGEERIINDLEEYLKGKPIKEYNKILLEEGIRSSITFPLKNNNEVIGIIFFSSKEKNVYKKEHAKFLKTLANSLVLSLEKDILIQDMVISSTLALAMLTEERDSETGEHLNRMKIYSRMIAEFLSKEEKYKNIIDLDYINDIERFAPLHDIGKVAIKDEILLKPGKLTYEEFEIMKTHATYGAKVLRRADENLKKKGRSIFKLAIEIAGGHHEKWDGSGYPHSRSGEEIPLSARIVALADVFDALTSQRPYKKPFSFDESVKIITDGSGKHFDPYIIDVFTKNLYKIEKKYLEFKNSNIL